MPIAKVVVTKEIDYRDGVERFSNGYTLDTGSLGTGEADMHTLAVALQTWERGFHASDVRFPYLNAGPNGSDSTYVEEFTTPPVGAQTPGADHPEVCVLGESKFGQRRYARKWFHLCRGIAEASGQSEVLATAVRTAMNTQLVKLTDGTLPGGAKYWTPKAGVLTTPFTCDPYLRTHQFDARGPRKRPVLGGTTTG
jgi:hypothetical protein